MSIEIYKVTCKPNKKLYFGIATYGAESRYRSHWVVANSKRKRIHLFHRALRKYGKDNFTLEVVYTAVNWQEACAVEKGLIAQYGTMKPNGYNMTAGGEGWLGGRHTEKNRLLFSDNAKKQFATEEGKAQQRRNILNNWEKPEFRANHTIRMAEKYSQPGAREAVSNRLKIHYSSPEAREVKRQQAIKQFASPEARQAMSAHAKEQFATPESRLQLSERVKKHFLDPAIRKAHGIKVRAGHLRNKIKRELEQRRINGETSLVPVDAILRRTSAVIQPTT